MKAVNAAVLDGTSKWSAKIGAYCCVFAVPTLHEFHGECFTTSICWRSRQAVATSEAVALILLSKLDFVR